MAILVVSSELEELLGICHRIVVLKHGRVTSGFERASFSKERIIAAAAFGANT
jgi:ABC-type sugar transport system ATPase subunit